VIPLIVWMLILIFIFPVYLFSIIIFGIYRLLVNFIVWKWKPDFIEHFSSRELSFACDDFNGKVRKNVLNVSILNGNLSAPKLREGIRTRLFTQKYFTKLQCRPVLFMGYWFWEKTSVNLESQVFEHNEVKTDDELKSYLPKWIAEGYGPGKPMWSVMLIKLVGGRTAVVYKLHHMVGDGVSFMKLLEYMCDEPWTHLETPEIRPFSLMHWIYAWYTFPWNALKSYRLARIRKGFRPTIYYGEGFTSWTELSLEKLRVVRRASKCMFQSALGGILSNAFYRLLEHSGKSDIPATVRLVIPIPYPGRTDKQLTNHVGWLHAELPIGGGQKALFGFDSNVRKSYTLGMHGVMWEFFRGMYLVPNPILKKQAFWGESNIPPVILSSIPGTLTKTHMMGNEVLRAFPILGLGCSMGVNACVATYKDTAQFTVRVSKEILPSQEMVDLLLNKYIHEELDALYHQAIAKQEQDLKSPANNHLQIQMR